MSPTSSARAAHGPGEPLRRVRAGDVDRSRVTGLLAEHYAQGRLDHAELDARTTLALTAVYLDELDPLLADLPSSAPAPVHSPVRTPRPPRPATSGPPPLLVVPLLVALVLVTRGAALWLLALGWFVLARARSGAVSQGWRYGPLVCRHRM